MKINRFLVIRKAVLLGFDFFFQPLKDTNTSKRVTYKGPSDSWHPNTV